MVRRKVLILCTGNSARSQMAEGLINHLLAGSWEAASAGTEPAEAVHPLAVRVMAEIEIDIASQYPKHVETMRDGAFDLVVTVCDNAARNCPLWLGSGRVEHVGFPDPAEATGSEAERLEAFRAVRDGLRGRLIPFLRAGGDDSRDRGAPPLFIKRS